MSTAKVYYDIDGNDCTLNQMVVREPGWAAVRIQEGEKAIQKVVEQAQRIEELEKELKLAVEVIELCGQDFDEIKATQDT